MGTVIHTPAPGASRLVLKGGSPEETLSPVSGLRKSACSKEEFSCSPGRRPVLRGTSCVPTNLGGVNVQEGRETCSQVAERF